MIPSMAEASNDLMLWNATNDDIFTIKSAYYLIEKQSENNFNSIYKDIWKWEGTECIRAFM